MSLGSKSQRLQVRQEYVMNQNTRVNVIARINFLANVLDAPALVSRFDRLVQREYRTLRCLANADGPAVDGFERDLRQVMVEQERVLSIIRKAELAIEASTPVRNPLGNKLQGALRDLPVHITAGGKVMF